MEFIGTRVQTSVQNVSTCELQKSFRENLTQWDGTTPWVVFGVAMSDPLIVYETLPPSFARSLFVLHKHEWKKIKKI